MIRAIIKRIGYSIPSVFIVIVFVFILARVLPGNPVSMYAGESASQQTIDEVTQRLGLDKPIPEQFINYLGSLAKGDLGYAWHTSNSVTNDLLTRFPATLELALFSMILAIVIGVPLGIISAVRKNSVTDHVSRVISLLGSAMPVFWLGLMLIYFFYFKLNVSPAPMGRLGMLEDAPDKITGLYILDGLLTGDFEVAASAFSQILLPGISLSLGSLAIIARMTRTSMIETLSQEYIRTAKAKGLSKGVIICKHALLNAMIPIITVIGSQFGIMLSATVVVETIFSWPGIGSYLTQSILVTDYAPIQGFALIAALIYMVINLLLDIIYTIIDPRVRLEN